MPVLKAIKEKSLSKYFFIGLIYLLVVTSVFFVLLPILQRESKINQALSNELTQLQMLRNAVSRRSTVIESLEANQGLIQSFESQIPRLQDFPVVLLAIHRLADEAGVNVKELKYSPLQRNGNIYWYPISLKADAAYPDVYDFIQALSNFTPAMKETAMKITADKQEKVGLELGLDLYLIPDNQITDYNWELPVWQLTDYTAKSIFGVPLGELTGFYNGGIKLLGIVSHADGSKRALVSFQGKESWQTLGSTIGIGKITSIQSQSITVNINGFAITITMGGS